MKLYARITTLLILIGISSGLLALQGGFQDGYSGFSQRQRRGAFPEGDLEKSEYSWSRLRYSTSRGGGGYGYGFGYGGGAWSRDYPKADRQFLIALRRLTRIQARPVEQVVDLDSDGQSGRPDDTSIFDYPWVYAVQVQTWSFTDAEAKKMREYLLKGGFLMVDDFHGTA